MVKRKCLFCQQDDAKMSLEHVLSRSITKHLKADGPFTATRMHMAPGGPLEKVVEYETPAPTFTRRGYCEICNSRWMQQMDRAISPLVGPLIRGEPTTLHSEDQKRLAAWTAKIALVHESLAGKSTEVPDTEYFRFFNERRPLAGEPIRLAHYSRADLRSSFARRVLLVRDDRDVIIGVQGVLLTITIGHLVAQLTLPSREPHFPPEVGIEGQDRIGIWPARVQSVSWPPDISLNDAGMARFTTQIPRRSMFRPSA